MTASSQIAERTLGTHLPLPDRQFRRFINVFHVVFLGGLVCSLLFRWRRTELNWTWVDTSLMLLAAVQAALYIRFFIVAAERITAKEWGFYFGAAFALWFVEWRLEPDFEWAVGALLGQMFGVLRPRISLPASAAVFATYFFSKFGWQRLAAFTAWEWSIGLGMIASWTALGLFIHKLVVTSAERARLIDELEAARTQLELARQRDAELAALRERERLARDLHDSLGHSLVTLSVQLEAIQRLLPTNPAKATELLQEMKGLTRTSMEQLRRSLAGLRAPGLGDRALKIAIEQFCRELEERTSITVECNIAEQADALPPAVAEVLWRAAHEGLANAEKHSGAAAVQVALFLNGTPSTEACQAVLRVSDDGLGLPKGAESVAGHYGLRGLRERVEGVGGTFHIERAQPKGTKIEITIPVLCL